MAYLRLASPAHPFEAYFKNESTSAVMTPEWALLKTSHGNIYCVSERAERVFHSAEMLY